MARHAYAPRAAARACRAAAAALLAAMAWAPAHAMHLMDVQGNLHTLEVHKGKWVVLNVWATWCAPCIKEMPELQALARSRDDVVVLGLAADGDDVARLRQFAQALRVTYPIIAGNDKLMKEFKVQAYPTTMLFNAQGKLVMTRLGQVTKADLDAHLPARAAR
ncbi:TlpA family protein disulfide reductase [Massilia sp. GCM10020059]|uniref:TlpA family protein disulfide reductase n=1 Tax=Massilia agrisoli TaxID=2892444 RepID=A0ABS8ISY2_9BURK|nr:TlpA disulfide reductase family protein [Massilia agrisoli]MCC6070354.1 TlpA family protein disulfide reductase [Massilia agrisoli]